MRHPARRLRGRHPPTGEQGLLPAEPVRPAVALARQWVDGALEAGALDAAWIERLGKWCGWMREALAAAAQNQPSPALPASLTAPLVTQPPGAAKPPAADPE